MVTEIVAPIKISRAAIKIAIMSLNSRTSNKLDAMATAHVKHLPLPLVFSYGD
ncbi:MAG: hypothetical protein IKP64_05860 [Selenomonadaceae bacterium]|nr:hypothetical protein [Selenomonadaceae bacterium]